MSYLPSFSFLSAAKQQVHWQADAMGHPWNVASLADSSAAGGKQKLCNDFLGHRHKSIAQSGHKNTSDQLQQIQEVHITYV